MAWRDRYRPGSFRGVPFVTVQHGVDLGRRGETHEFPERDAPYREDLGRAARRWSVQAFVIGTDYMAGRDALIAAIEAPGAGTLVHPFLGTFQASVDSCHLSESTTEGGMARFDLAFIEPGTDLAAAQAPDTSQASKDVAGSTLSNAAGRFDASFSTSDKAQAVAERALQTIRILGSEASLVASTLGGSGDPLRALQGGVAMLTESSILASGATSLLGVAGEALGDASYLAAAVTAVVCALGRLGPSGRASIVAVQAVAITVEGLPPIVPTTPSRELQGANQQALADLVVAAAGAVAVAIVADLYFASYDDAIAMRDQVGRWLDDRAIAAADRDNRPAAADLDALRRALVADVTARGGSLARLFAYTPPIVSPALVIAWRLSRQPASLLDQTADLVARNRVRHPGFVPAAALQVPTAEALRGV